MIDYNNAYFTTQDKAIQAIDNFVLPSDWWSRPYEYAFALQFVDKNDVIADMGCGWMGRPLTAELARQGKECYGIDADERVMDLEKIDHLYYLPMDFTSSEMNYFKASTFDKIFCISVLEDLSAGDMLAALKNFARLIKPDGKIIITLDSIWEPWRIAEPYPTVNLIHFMEHVKRAGLRFVGKWNIGMPDNAVHHSRWNLSCFHCLLERNK